MNFTTKLLVWAVLTLLVVSKASANEPEPFRGIWCGTEAQVSSVVTEGTKRGGAAEGIQAVNLEAGKNVCVYAVIYGVRKERLASLESPDGLLDIVRWEVRAIHTPYGFIEVEPVQWFTLEGSLSKGV